MCFLLTILLCSCSGLRPGYLLFHVAERGNAITDVTPGMIDHVAIVLSSDSVIEAVPQGGVRTATVEALHQQPGYYIIGRVQRADPTLSVANARLLIGLPYDSLFLPDNEAVYCSELVLASMVDHRGQRLLRPVPMSFHDSSGRITEYWRQFYGRRGRAVPEGQPGSNPGELSRRREVRLKGRLY